ncbi:MULTISPECIES: PEP-CTERM sorting domain-containing protein [unclassified Microcoleus]|uniref:PEP-CTERM sorting domain-containing protein n=1 Tax=unclassified Microcoleus TaxID=2642155 RepID=UPI002FD1C239
MCQKQRLRLGSAIASTILSCAALSLAGVDQAQAAVLTYSFNMAHSLGNGFFKVNNSSLTGIGLEQVAVSEGRFNPSLIVNYLGLEGKNYYNLAGATALFYQGDFRGLQARGEDTATREIIIPPDEPYGPFYVKYQGNASWSIASVEEFSYRWISVFTGYRELYSIGINPGSVNLVDKVIASDISVSYDLMKTEAEPVPEPITAAGTALALAGLSWLKHKKKMAA